MSAMPGHMPARIEETQSNQGPPRPSAWSVTGIRQLVSRERRQYLVLAILSIAVLELTAAGHSADSLLFRRFTGAADPVAVAAAITLLGAVLLSVLLVRGGFAIYRRGNVRGLLQAAGIAALFGAIIILADLRLPGLRAIHPKDMNVPFPESLLFYPVIGFMAEIVFHVLPLSLLLMMLPVILKKVRLETIVWTSIPLVALLEPTLQAALLVAGAPLIGAPHDYVWWAVGFDWVHIFLINVVQLLLFSRYDFVSMYSLRLVYYLIWHIVWGHARLGVLFSVTGG
jgi:hypothetical protein